MIGRWPQAPDLIDPIVGYRGWRYTTSDRGVQLFPLNLTVDDLLPGTVWEGARVAWVAAACPSPVEPTHLAPDESCTCGFYAMKSPDDLAMFAAASDLHATRFCQVEGVEGAVFGRVLLAGKVIEHETGYRAERARIAELIPTTTDAGITLSLASRLDLPVGPALDTASLLHEMEKLQRGPKWPSRPGLLGRWRLRTHRRRFHLIGR